MIRILKSSIIFATSTEHNITNNIITIVGIIEVFATIIPVVLGISAINKRLKIAIPALIVVAILHLIRNVISLLIFNMVVDTELMIILPITSLCLLIIALFNEKVQAWLSEPATNKKSYIFLFSICSIIYMMIFARGLADMNKQISLDRLRSDSSMKFVGSTAGKYYYYINLSKKVITTPNGYIIPIIVTDIENKQSQYHTNVIIDKDVHKFCMENNNTDCNNPDSFKFYELTSPIGEAAQYVENSKENY